MLEELPNLPPAIPLLVNEVLIKSKSWDGARRRLRRLLPELRRQSRSFDLKRMREEPLRAPPTELAIYPPEAK